MGTHMHNHHRPHLKLPTHHVSDSARSIAVTISLLIMAPLIAILLTMFVFQSYQVDGQSMQPTLHDKDRLVIWKLPRTWARITGHSYVPKRGDIIVLNDAKIGNYGRDPNEQLIKRVVGLPGDHVVVSNGVVTIYDKSHPNGFQPDKTLPYGTVIPYTPDDTDVHVPAGNVFVMGDNRGNSLDSRDIGPVPVNNIAGKLIMRVVPLGDAARF
jgi:signal peptidase I